MKGNSTQKTLIIVLAVLLVAALIFGGVQMSRSSSLRTQLGSLSDTLDSRNADLAAASSELDSVKTALAELAEAQPDEDLAEALRAKEAELEAAKTELEAAIAEREKLSAQQLANADAQSTKDTALEASAAELESAKAALEAVEAELAAVKAELAELSAQHQETVDTLQAKESELESTVSALTEMTAKQKDTEDALAAAKTDLATAKSDLTAAKTDLDTAKSDLAEKEAALAEAKTDLAEKEAALAEALAVHHHVWGPWERDMEPNCEAEGREIRRCESDPSHEEMRLVPALGHDWVLATFTQPRRCARCGEVSGESSPETTFPTMEEVKYLSQRGNHPRVSEADKTRLVVPAESSYLSTPYRTTLSNNIYIMPIPELGHGNLGIVNKGTEVVVLAKRNGYLFFVTYDGRMGWNGSPLVG